MISRHILAIARENRAAALVGLLLLANVTGVFKSVYGLDTAIIVTVLAGYKTFYNSIAALLEKTISADIALCVAVIAALSVGENVAAAEAMFIVMVGETLESYAAGRTSEAIERFVARMPRVARLVRDGVEEEVEASSLASGDLIVVRVGEFISADGIIADGASSIDESSVTGEPLARDKEVGDEVFSGTLNGNGLLRIRVTRAGGATTLARVAQLVEEARGMRAPVERLADRYAKYFLPALLLSGALTFYLTGNWLRTVAVLIVACPCALILATPTAMVAAIGGLARRGILVRGGAVLQLASKVDTAVFDKTGTLTEGNFTVTKIITTGQSEERLLALAAAAERGGHHALARVIVEEAERRGVLVPDVSEAHAVPGLGVECLLDGRRIRAGSAAFTGGSGAESIIAEADSLGATTVFISEDGQLAGAILCRDTPRQGAREAIAGLEAMGIGHLVMLTGDRRRPAESIARSVGLEHFEAELLPEQKLDRIRQFDAQGRTVAMVGDGINDAPALAAASVGIAVAGASDIAAEAAQVVFLPHSLETLPRFFEVSRRAMQTAWLNIVLFAGAVNALAVIACATGKLGPVGAAVTHQLASFCVMMNSLRLLRVEPRGGFRWRPWLAASRAAIPWRAAIAWVRDRRDWVRRYGPAAFAFILLASGFYSIAPDEVGVIERFGKKVTPFRDPGLHYKLPWPVEKLTRFTAHRVRVVEMGFRSNSTAAAAAEPSAYEWNAQHRGGRYESRPEEALALTGDQNMIEVNAVVHYDVPHPDAFLFRQLDGEAVVRAAAESVIHGLAGASDLDTVLTTGRAAIEQRTAEELQRRLDRYDTGARVLQVKLEDVHPSLEVVDAFRAVSDAFEEKNRSINEAEGYRNEQVALARGNARALLESAAGYKLGRTNRAQGDSIRFSQWSDAARIAQGPTETRLYLEAMEQVLPGKKKLIVDSSKGRRHLLLLEDGVEIVPLRAKD